MRAEIVFGGPISDPGLLWSVKELLDHAYELRRYSGVVKPQRVWYMAIGRERELNA